MGHAVYTLSDPRAVILKEYARSLSEEKGLTEEFMLYSKVEQLASELLTGRKNLHKPICCNVDFYSGFVYEMLGLPKELYTAPVRRGPYRRLECPPDGGALRGRQADPPPV